MSERNTDVTSKLLDHEKRLVEHHKRISCNENTLRGVGLQEGLIEMVNQNTRFRLDFKKAMWIIFTPFLASLLGVNVYIALLLRNLPS